MTTPVTPSQVEEYASTDPDRLIEELMKMHGGMTVSKGHHESMVNGYVRDIEWNAFDLWHRVYVHHTYPDFLKVFSGKHFSVNVTRWGRLPIFIQVANAWVKRGVILQTMSVLGIIYCHQIVRLTQHEEKVLFQVDWFTASHWLFKWLHGPFNRRLLKLQRVQDEEDFEIRDQRHSLRKLGFSFTTDEPDFINSNRLTNNVRVPAFRAPIHVSIANLPINSMERITMGALAFLVNRRENHVEIWPALCPHEGANMTSDHVCGDILQCPWHGRQFRSIKLGPGERQSWRFLDVTLKLQDKNLVMSYTPSAEVAVSPEANPTYS